MRGIWGISPFRVPESGSYASGRSAAGDRLTGGLSRSRAGCHVVFGRKTNLEELPFEVQDLQVPVQYVYADRAGI